MLLSGRLERLRKNAGLSQNELASKIGVSQKTISSWETGRTYPRMKEIQLLQEAFGCSMEAITGEKTHDISDISFDDILLKLRDFTEDELQRLRDVCSQIINNKREMAALKKSKEEQLKRIADYENKIRQLEEQLRRENT